MDLVLIASNINDLTDFVYQLGDPGLKGVKPYDKTLKKELKNV